MGWLEQLDRCRIPWRVAVDRERKMEDKEREERKRKKREREKEKVLGFSGLKTRFYTPFWIFETRFHFYENSLVFSIFSNYGTIQTFEFKF